MENNISKIESKIKKIFYAKINLFIFFGVLIILISGLIFTYLTTKKVEDDTNAEFLSYVNTFVAGVNPERIERLTNTPADLESDDYQRIREQLNKMSVASKISGIRWIYTMFERNNEIIFGPDSILDGEYGHSEPGDVYTSISGEMRQILFNNVLENGITEIFGPYTDDWGEWLSVFAPIKNFQTEKIIGILGVDIDYHYYRSIIIKRQILPIVSTILILIIFISISIYLLRIKKMNEILRINEEKYKDLYDVSINDNLRIKKDMEIIKNMSLESSKMNKLMVGRELKMIELKNELIKLKGENKNAK